MLFDKKKTLLKFRVTVTLKLKKQGMFLYMYDLISGLIWGSFALQQYRREHFFVNGREEQMCLDGARLGDGQRETEVFTQETNREKMTRAWRFWY